MPFSDKLLTGLKRALSAQADDLRPNFIQRALRGSRLGKARCIMRSLKERFEEFILSIEGVESVDRLMADCDLPGRKRADYLAFNRSVIIEQKSLDIDPGHKVPEFFEKHTDIENSVDGDLTALSHLLRSLPEGTKLGINLFRSLTKGLDDILSHADKQTRDTRKTFLISDAIGVVIILNDSAPTLEPDAVTIKAAEMLRKVTPAGELRYPENQVVILISEAHRIPSDKNVELIPTSTSFSEQGGQNPFANHFAQVFLSRWAEFNGALFMGDADVWEGFEPRDPAKIFQVGHGRAGEETGKVPREWSPPIVA